MKKLTDGLGWVVRIGLVRPLIKISILEVKRFCSSFTIYIFLKLKHPFYTDGQ
jgi:hypothetical protein